VEVFSEQELRRVAIDQYPPWVPRTDGHRPDGYWRVPCLKEKILLALEVELTQKRDLDYSLLAQFYAEEKSIFRVIWVTRTLSLAKHIQSIISET
jgi:hypothetical protein